MRLASIVYELGYGCIHHNNEHTNQSRHNKFISFAVSFCHTGARPHALPEHRVTASVASCHGSAAAALGSAPENQAPDATCETRSNQRTNLQKHAGLITNEVPRILSPTAIRGNKESQDLGEHAVPPGKIIAQNDICSSSWSSKGI